MKKKEKKEKIKTKASENIKIAFYLNLIFSALEIVGGYLTNSFSILSDAVHDLGDSISVGISYLFERKSQKLPDDKYSYGYLRYSLLGALITSFFLLLGSVVIIYNAIPRLMNPQSVNHDAMIIFAIFGVAINGYAAYRTSKGIKTNERVISLHMLEDVLGWVAVLIGSICIKVYNLPIIDPILSILIALYILVHVYKYLKDVFDIFMEKVPSNIKIDKIVKEILEKNTCIKDIHHIHIWTMDGTNNYMTAHVHLNTSLSEDEIIKLKEELKKELRERDIYHVTLEIEYSNENCEGANCKKAI